MPWSDPHPDPNSSNTVGDPPAPHEGQMKKLANLLRTGNLSNMLMVCEGHVFRIHDYVITAESPALAASMKKTYWVCELHVACTIGTDGL